MVILGACASWSLITAAARDGRPEGVLLAVLAVAAGYAAGRIGGALVPVAAPCAAALAGTVLTVAVPHLAPGPRITAPLGHAGASAALLALSAGAACCGAWASGVPAVRAAFRLLAVGIAVTAAVLGSVAGCVACAVVLLCSLAAGRVRRRGGWIAALGLAAGLVTGLTWAVLGSFVPDGLAASLEGRLTSRRVRLWADAWELLRGDMALGVGPGRFGASSPTAALSQVPDGRPHSAVWQQAAEQGVVGVVLLAAAFGWVLYALWRSPRPTPVVLTAGVALTGLAAIAAVGNALSFTAVPVGAGLLAGLATARPFADESPARATGVRPRAGRPSR
ncbi:O-antigen ligase family protein [Streptomyces sp. AC512_CC834]|uniref:O-antigen ligase family protein n=1 Tax=Streptomyces sp. AC512_CC834 TaxID=2823691 RepID=UPI0027E42DE4|nr:O-antigen ligase family protein [Streptomyces sp. AC512_CC834]